MFQRLKSLLLLLLVLPGLASCGPKGKVDSSAPPTQGEAAKPGAPPPRPHTIVFVSMDTARPDFLGCHGHPWAKTPHLDALAGEGLLYEDCLTPAPTTLASHVSMMTGHYPHTHGVPRNGFVVDDGNVMLAEILREAGYAAAGFLGGYPLARQFNFPQGFDYYDDAFTRNPGDGENTRERPASAVVDSALAHLKETGREQPLFYFLHFFDPHSPYEPPEEFEALYANVQDAEPRPYRAIRRRTRGLLGEARPGELDRILMRYAGEMSYVDAELGRFFEALRAAGRWDDALIVVTSDHGETLWDHAPYFNHGLTVYQATVAAIGIVRLPGARGAGARFSQPVTTMDWMPSILACVGAPIPEGLDGLDLGWASGQAPPADRVRFSQATKPYEAEPESGWQNRRKASCVVEGAPPWKYIDAPYGKERSLHDLGADPTEQKNLLEESPPGDRLRDLTEALNEWRDSADPKPAENLRDRSQDAEEKLRALGYL